MSEAVVYGAHQSNSEAGRLLASFWPRVMADIRNKPFLQTKPNGKKDEPIQELPLARIKKIMKQDGDVKMISAEAPILFSKAAEIFVSELSLRAWIHTEDNKRRTLQRNDIAMAITKYDQFDFLIDIVPREELKPPKRQDEVVRQPPNVMAPEQVQYYFQLSQLQSNNSTAGPQITQLPPGAHVIQQNGQILIATPHQLGSLAGTSTNGSSSQIVQLGNQDTSTESQQAQQSIAQQQNEHQQPQQQQQQPSQSTSSSTDASQSTNQTQLTSAGQQVHYVRVPQGASGANLSQLVLQQLQQQQQQQQQAQTQQENVQEAVATNSQGYQSLPGNLPSGAVYVMAQPSAQVHQNTTNTTQG